MEGFSIMVAYSLLSKTYRMYDKETNRIIERRDVVLVDNLCNKNNSEYEVSDKQYVFRWHGKLCN